MAAEWRRSAASSAALGGDLGGDFGGDFRGDLDLAGRRGLAVMADGNMFSFAN